MGNNMPMPNKKKDPKDKDNQKITKKPELMSMQLGKSVRRRRV